MHTSAARLPREWGTRMAYTKYQTTEGSGPTLFQVPALHSYYTHIILREHNA